MREAIYLLILPVLATLMGAGLLWHSNRTADRLQAERRRSEAGAEPNVSP